MIAVHYDTSLQQDGDVSGMTISAAPGIYKMKNWTLPLVSNDLYRSEGGLGTLWFSDAKMLESLGTGITGRLESFTNLTLDSLTVTAGHVAFPKQGGTVTVLGDLVVSVRLRASSSAATSQQTTMAARRSGRMFRSSWRLAEICASSTAREWTCALPRRTRHTEPWGLLSMCLG